MTRAEADIAAAGLMIPQPFAAGDDDHPSAFKSIDVDPVSNDVNFVEGFTAAFSAPTSQNGRYVTRQEMNAIGHLASVNEFKRQVGGIVTFNPTLSTRIGGYPKGAVLEYLDGLNYYRVVSRVDNNTVNFNEVGVDGTNWAYCEQGYVSEEITGNVDTGLTIQAGITFTDMGQFASPMSFTAQKTGMLNAIGAATFTAGTGSGGTGFGVCGHEATTGIGSPDTVQYKQFYTSGGSWGWTGTTTGISYGNHIYHPCYVEKGKTYIIYVIGSNCTISSSSLKIYIV